ncbi:energy transducer TonB [Vibrio sp. SS-MA-C1-2]|uniref:energy transducer TonB n=1 Tax=Vibrio sp. SS-MA-C1-2 TaxID=2908646 RepID=UPI001F434A86|nr:energy transducer TonB [Vibrio sp. SS-MA-C1-2]UJF18390.1 energy transducer TonB [Vibrio sp. SS-MA-C1-2]
MVRWLLSLPLAIVLTVGLFSFMSWMVDFGGHSVPEDKGRLSYDLVMIEPESETARRHRQLPEPPEVPETPEIPTAVNQSQQQKSISTVSPIKMANIALSTDVEGVSLTAPTSMNIGQNQQIMPLHRQNPRYPRRALQRKIEGYVILSFTIDVKGKPKDIKVIEAEPTRVFDREAKSALRRWQYQPMIVDGQVQDRVGQTVKLEFKINK